MEFPELGANCALITCKQLGEFDFHRLWLADFVLVFNIFFSEITSMDDYAKKAYFRKLVSI